MTIRIVGRIFLDERSERPLAVLEDSINIFRLPSGVDDFEIINNGWKILCGMSNNVSSII